MELIISGRGREMGMEMGRTARRDALLVPYDGEISKYSGVMLRRNTLSDTGFHGVRKIDVKGGVKFQAVGSLTA